MRSEVGLDIALSAEYVPSCRGIRASRALPRGMAYEQRAAWYVLTQQFLRKESTLTGIAFARLLAWLDDGIELSGDAISKCADGSVRISNGATRLSADELADETFNRIAKTLEDAGVIVTRAPGALLLRRREVRLPRGPSARAPARRP